MDAFGKTKPLTVDDFKPFEKAFGKDAHGNSKRKDEGEEGRFRFYSRRQIADRNDNLDISWLKDESIEDSANLPAPEVIAAEIAEDLRAALEQFEAIQADLEARTAK